MNLFPVLHLCLGRKLLLEKGISGPFLTTGAETYEHMRVECTLVKPLKYSTIVLYKATNV